MEIIKLIISSLGGGAAVATALILFFRGRIEAIIDKKIEYKFDKQLETDKGVIEQKKYVSQNKFDKEFIIIQELMEKSFDFTYLTWNTYLTIGSSDKDDAALREYMSRCDEFTLYYMRNCAFIPRELAEPFDLFVKKINEFRSAAKGYKELLLKVMGSSDTSKELNERFQKYIDTMKTIHNEINKESDYSHDILVLKTREYYEKLEIK